MTSARDVIEEHLWRAAGICHASDLTDSLISALESAGYVIERGWQSMETAPKDGSSFLVGRVDGDVGCEPIEISNWYVAEHYEYEHVKGALYRRVRRVIEGWNNNGHRATHWRPLPSRPQEPS